MIIVKLGYTFVEYEQNSYSTKLSLALLPLYVNQSRSIIMSETKDMQIGVFIPIGNNGM
jgi:hypothetical protein